MRLLPGCKLPPLPSPAGSALHPPGPGSLEPAGPGPAGGSGHGGSGGGGGGSSRSGTAYGRAADGGTLGELVCGAEDDVGWDEHTPLVCVVSSSSSNIGSGSTDVKGQGQQPAPPACVYGNSGHAQENSCHARQGLCFSGPGEVGHGACSAGSGQLKADVDVQQLQEEGGHAPSTAAAAAPEETLLTAVRHPATRPLLLSCCFIMFALSIAYFGVTLALGALAGSLHLNFFLTAVRAAWGPAHVRPSTPSHHPTNSSTPASGLQQKRQPGVGL